MWHRPSHQPRPWGREKLFLREVLGAWRVKAETRLLAGPRQVGEFLPTSACVSGSGGFAVSFWRNGCTSLLGMG